MSSRPAPYHTRPLGPGTPGVAWDVTRIPENNLGLTGPLFWAIYFTWPCGFVYRMETRKTLRGAMNCHAAVARRLARRRKR